MVGERRQMSPLSSAPGATLKNPTRRAAASLETLAAVACLSKYHFLRVFKEVVGRTPAAYACELRLRFAAETIARGVSIEAAARRVGYSNRHALIRALKKKSLHAT